MRVDAQGFSIANAKFAVSRRTRPIYWFLVHVSSFPRTRWHSAARLLELAENRVSTKWSHTKTAVNRRVEACNLHFRKQIYEPTAFSALFSQWRAIFASPRLKKQILFAIAIYQSRRKIRCLVSSQEIAYAKYKHRYYSSLIKFV